ncbi:16S rRNA (uracil(1498)-N(3))-methyltransferase [Peribacillus deserti]|uniref:Ribosomal RNA small subunit methyltransferase E n=1 Tax=Peribacillus deserti TaxID=673318 RepID=A0A2N5M9F0_9BACI|nr:16S rRNA (uracil(1498)-N(3))-methyltransferase [Peribacillus deserti]PLT30955.1 16S rRNA (uracil(1498)-N(3))-methyltransferase [Peribacillus deserti]
MQRYFISKESIEGSLVTITGDDFHHLANVMRSKPGDHILCVVPQEKTALVEITEITNEAIHANVIKWMDESKEMPIKVTIASGLPKGDKLDYIIQKGTELGAAGFIPFIAARSIVKWDEKKAAKKTERLQKIAKEAAEQSHRGIVPSIANPVRINELIKLSDEYKYKLIAYEEDAKLGEASQFAGILKEVRNGESVLFVFGPEGGLSSDEIEKFKENGFVSCGLGPRILRTETAPLYALSAISYHTELLR